MYYGRVQQAVVGRVVLLTFIPKKTAFWDDYQILRGTVNA